MVNPVTGPFTITRDQTWPGSALVKSHLFRKWYRQRRPHNLPLEYDYNFKNIISYRDYRDGSTFGGYYGLAPDYELISRELAVNQCYSKFVSAVNEQSQWAVNLIEAKQATDSIVGITTTLTRFTTLVARRRFFEAAKLLKLTKAPSGVSRKKSLANNWLAYHFGWEPLVKDIGTAIDTLIDPYIPKRVNAVGVGESSSRSEDDHNSTSYRIVEIKNKQYVKMSALVSVSNPNLFIASQLGFVNPASVAWELVPFSFVVDWFANVGQVLSSYTDFMGVSLSESFTSYFQKSTKKELWHYGNFSVPSGHSTGEIYLDIRYDSRFHGRRSGIESPVFRVRPFKGFSPIRGATAISLLLQKLR